ncbi:hypothetical protein [Nocardia sp. CNY236]|uniref:hypothetical protein n=1 Tax=Nocardia sp. CNY236 TaxID=1169152 RepID=UPI000423EB32|nr:hypothetical protein [Nocardia sp. CNY236]
MSLHDITTPDGVERTHHAVRLNTVACTVVVDDHGRVVIVRVLPGLKPGPYSSVVSSVVCG